MNFPRRGTVPYELSANISDISLLDCIIDGSTTDVLSLNKDRCGLTPWVKAREATFGPSIALIIIVVLCFVVAMINGKVEQHTLGIIGRKKWEMGDWRENVTKLPAEVRFSRLFSSNIWYIPFVTLGKVNECNNLTLFQSSFPL
jgi:hypothetical protein